MSFYQSKEGVLQYIEMAEGYNGRELVEVLSEHLEEEASVLEIGMGPGVDLDLDVLHRKLISVWQRRSGWPDYFNQRDIQ